MATGERGVLHPRKEASYAPGTVKQVRLKLSEALRHVISHGCLPAQVNRSSKNTST
jgi:hypothetical protein